MMMTRVAVIGVGNIGIGAMTDLVLHGIEAVGVDVTDEALKRAEEEILRNVRFAAGPVEDAAEGVQGPGQGAHDAHDRSDRGRHL